MVCKTLHRNNLCLNIFHLLALKPNLEEKKIIFIQTNSFSLVRIQFYLLRASGLLWRLQKTKIEQHEPNKKPVVNSLGILMYIKSWTLALKHFKRLACCRKMSCIPFDIIHISINMSLFGGLLSKCWLSLYYMKMIQCFFFSVKLTS